MRNIHVNDNMNRHCLARARPPIHHLCIILLIVSVITTSQHARPITSKPYQPHQPRHSDLRLFLSLGCIEKNQKKQRFFGRQIRKVRRKAHVKLFMCAHRTAHVLS